MNETLHPSNLGEILDRTVQLYRTQFLVFFGIAAVPTTLILIAACGVFLAFAWSGHSSSPVVGFIAGIAVFAAMLIAVPLYVAATALASAAMNHAAARALFSQQTSIVDAYKAAWALGWRYIGLYLLQGLIVFGVPCAVWFVVIMVFTIVGALLQKSGAALDGFVAVAFILVLAVLATYCIWMALRLSLTSSACVVERLQVLPALKRSLSLTRGTMTRIFLLYLLGSVLNYALSIMIVASIFIVAAFIPAANSPDHSQSIHVAMVFVAYCASFAVQAFTKPVYGIALVAFYYDQRIRLEGFDIEWLMHRAGLNVPAEPQMQMALATGPEPTHPAESA